MTNVVEILITAKNLTGPAMASVNAEVNKAGGAMRAFHKTAALAGVGLAAVGYESVKMAAKFDASMTLLHTQAGVAKDQMGTLKKGVLDLAGKVGQDPDSLAESLFHVESNFESMGISSKKALSLVETAAKGATTGHADLVDVTNALTAAVASGIPGVQNFDQAMGVLNATVGVGDMKMQDLAAAFSSGMVATVKGFGLSITDVGAALAVFGDNNIRGSLAGNQLRMSVMALAKPVSTAKDSLDKLGLSQTTLAKDMQKGGLKLALEDLVGRMHKAGISSKEQGQIITDAFGRKAGAGLNILVGQMDRLESKYPALEKGAKGFGTAWADTQKTFAFQMKALQASFDALMISVGEKLIPPLQAFVSVLLAHKGAAVAATAALAGLLAATVAVSVAMKAAAAAQLLWAAGARAVAVMAGVFETVALRAMYMREAFLVAGGGVAGLKAAFASLGKVAKASLVVGGLALLALAVAKIAGLGKTAPPDIDKLSTSLKELSSSGKFSGELHKTFGDMDGLIDKVKKLNTETAKSKETAFGFRVPGLDDLADKIANGINNMTKGKDSLDSLKGDFKSLDSAMAQNAAGGYAKEAAKDFNMMRDALKGAGYSTKQINALFPQYRETVAGLAGDQTRAAESMGLFGEQAVSTQKALDGEAQSAKGLEQSIMALNAVHRGAFDAETAFQQAISDASKAVKENGKSLDVHSEAGRKNRDVLSSLAAKTEDLVDKKLKEKVAWKDVDATYKEGRRALIATAVAMGDTKKQAEQLADQILKAPKAQTTKFKGDIKDLQSKIATAKEKLKHATPSQTAKIKGNIADLQRKIAAAQAAIWGLKGRTITVQVRTAGIAAAQAAIAALGGIPAMPHAMGGLVRRASGGPVQAFPGGGLVEGPGTPTSDSITALMGSGAAAQVSDTEYVVRSAAVKKYGVPLLDALNAGRLKLAGFAKGGHLSKSQKAAKARADAERQARHEAMGDLTISRFGQMAGYKHSEFGSALAKSDSISSLVNALNQWRSIILKATHGSTESKLLKQLDSSGRALLTQEKALGKVNAALDKAKDKLSSLKDAAAQLSSSIKSSVMGSGSVVNAAQSSAAFSGSGGILSGMRASTAQAQGFASMLEALKKKGLNSQSLSEIAQAGIEGGGLETAQRLMSASSSDIKQINSLEKLLTTAAGAAGKTTADAVYAGQIKAQEKLVKSLAGQQGKLVKSMDKLTAAMEKAIEKAFGKKASGGIVGAAASGGLRGGLTWVGEHEPELLDLPVGSRVWSGPDSRRKAATPWASMLNEPRRGGGRTAGAGGGSMQPVIVHQTITLDGKVIARQILDPLRGEVQRISGGNVQKALGRGNG